MKQVPFQLEKTVPGTFLMQGLLGGVLGGFFAALIAIIAWDENDFRGTLNLAIAGVCTGAIVGVIKSILIWGVYRLTNTRLTAVARVSGTTIVTALFIAVLGRQFNFDESFLPSCLVWALSVGIPVALLVGSSVKPWEIFTFGSIAAEEGNDQRSGSRSILRTLCTFPLRFLSIGTIALFLLILVVQERAPHLPNEILGTILFFVIAGVYPLISAYITFRSPRKIVLLACGIIFNIPIALVGLFFYGIYGKAYWLGVIPLIISGYCACYLLAWLIFLIARLTLITPSPPLSIIDNKSIAAAPNLDHHCLGSRFTEWQQHVA